MHIVLCQPQIPPNTGNVARLCVATHSVLHLVRPLGFSTNDAALRRAGLDYWEFLTVHHHEDWEEFLSKREGRGAMYFYSKKAERPYTRPNYREGDYLVFGAESTGLSEEMLTRYADSLYTTPLWGPTRSIKLSTSVGIVLNEALRQVHQGF